MRWLSLPLAAASILGIWIVPRRPRLGWAWCALVEIAWIAYSIAIASAAGWGLAILCTAYLIVYLDNLRRESRG
jgi:membrane protein insertase Oxa1/YidC/SpoIIIJ